MVATGARVGSWTRGAVCCISVVALAWISPSLVLWFAVPEFVESAAFLRAGGGGDILQSTRDLGARKKFVSIFGAVPVSGPGDAVPLAQNTGYALRGLFEMVDGRDLAMIELSGATAVYQERDGLPGGETVFEISAGGVTIDGPRGRALIAFEDSQVAGMESAEILATAAEFPGSEASAVAGAATAVFKLERRPPLSRAALTEQVLSAGALSAVRFERVRVGDGKIGLRVQWLRSDALTDAIGLRQGDVILAVNGLSVDDSETLGQLIKALPASREVVIDVDRGSGPHRLVIPLSHG